MSAGLIFALVMTLTSKVDAPGRVMVGVKCGWDEGTILISLTNTSMEKVIIPNQLPPWSVSGDVLEWDLLDSGINKPASRVLINDLESTVIQPGEVIESVTSLVALQLVARDEMPRLTGVVRWRVKLRATETLGFTGAGQLSFEKGRCIR
jgi:hypothetical protein